MPQEIATGAMRRSPENSFGIVPMPYKVTASAGKPFDITSETLLVSRGAEAEPCAVYLQERLRTSCGLNLQMGTDTSANAVVLAVSDDAVAFSEADAYCLASSPEKITIAAKTGRGLFYGVQSLLQLLPPAVYSDTVQDRPALLVPGLRINDKPSMDSIRGLHVDISRHFRTKEELCTIIDSMAMHKLNTLHLHLTDNQSWRIEIKAYPKLTTIGARGSNTNPQDPAKFWTQEDARQICAYARSRYISIIPEIDLPGHMSAAIRAYPELKSPTEPRDPGDVIRIDEKGQAFAKTVLREVDNIFQPDYIHIGCDEVNHGTKGVPIYTDQEIVDFARNMSSFIKDDLKRTPIVWDDAFVHGLHDEDTLVQWWRYGKNYWWRNLEDPVDAQLNQQRQPFIFSPAYWTYFDMPNVKTEEGFEGWAKPISAAEAYNWDPYGDMLGITGETRDQARGAIACTWSEGMQTMEIFCQHTYPRLAGFSERIWRGGKLEAPTILSWPDYRDQVLIPFQLKRYDALGLHYWGKNAPELIQNLPDNRKQLPCRK